MDYPGLSEWVQAASHPAKAVKPVLETAGAWKVPAAPSAPAPLSAPLPAPDPHSALNQKFTELFATAERPIVADSLLQAPGESASHVAAPLRPPDPRPQPAAASVQAAPEPGEFTRMFQSPVATPPGSAPAPLPPVPVAAPPPLAKSPPPPAAKEPGEFTRMFHSPAGPETMATPAAPAPVPANAGPGEFTRFFETPSPAGPLPQSPAVQQPLSPQGAGRSPFNPVSEFTRTFGKPGTEAPAPPPAVAPLPEPGEFTRMFHSPAGGGMSGGLAVGSPAATPGPPASQPQPPTPQAATPPLHPSADGATRGFSIPAPLPVAPQPGAPGEYTRQFSAAAQLTFGQTSATPAPASSPSPQAFAPPAMAQPAMPNMAPAPAPARKSNLPLILGIVGIVLLAALLIAFFAMRPK